MNEETNFQAPLQGAADAESGSAPQIPIRPVENEPCASCGAVIDMSGIETFSRITCPSCGAECVVPGRFAHFKLLKHLGTGGMGTTFLAEDEQLGRRVAVKVIRNRLEAGSAAFETFKNEAQSAARLNHPHVAQVYSFGQESGCPYLEMELVPGGDLAQFIVNGSTLDPAFVMRVGLEIAEGLKAAEEVGLFHGDVKPDNILFDENMSAKLVDFGIASRTSQGAAGELWGTPFYIAPEKVQKKTNSARSDIYSLGATLYHAIAGKPPYDGEDAIAVVKARFNGPPPPIESIRPDVEPEVSRILARMMYNDLFMRYPNYTSLIGDLKKYLAGVSELRKQGPRTAAARAAAATGSFKAEAAAPSAQTGGKKKFVIQRGQMEAAEARKEMQAASSSAAIDTASIEGTDSPVVIRAEEPEKKKRKGVGCSAKAILILLASFFGIIVIGVVVAIAMMVSKASEENKRIERTRSEIAETEAACFKAGDEIEPLLEAAKARDAAMLKEFKPLEVLVKKAFDVSFPIPDLEPQGAAEAAAAAEAPSSVNGAETPAAEAPAAAEEGAAAAVADAVSSQLGEAISQVADEMAGALATAMNDPMSALLAAAPLVQSVENKVLVHARDVRAALRECEKIAAEDGPVFESPNGPQTLDDLLAALAKREEALAARTNQTGRMRTLLARMDNSTREMKRGVARVVQEGQKYIRERERRLAEEAEAELKRQEEERKKAEEAEAAARGADEADRVRSVAASRQDLIDRFEYETFVERMKRMESELSTPEGQDELKWTIARAERMVALRKWLLEDVRRNGEVQRGFRGKMLLGVTPDMKKIKVNLMPDFEVEKMTVTDWVVLARALLENRRPDRGGITPSEHGEMLFNTAIFAYLHGGSDPGAIALSRALAKRAVAMRSSLEPDAKHLLPIFGDEEETKEETGVPSEGAAALDF